MLKIQITLSCMFLLLTGCVGATSVPLIQPVATPTLVARLSLLPTPTSDAAPTAAVTNSGDNALPTPTPEPTPLSAFQPDALQLSLRPVVDGLNQPLFITHAGDGSGRLFVVEKGGLIRIFQAGEVLATPFLDLAALTSDSGSEQGLLGLAFAPGYAQSGLFFVNYTDAQGDTQIVRYQARRDVPNQADPASVFAVLTVAQPARNHNGGMLLFGQDGYLYIGLGDGGGSNGNNAQKADTLLGKMLRIDVTSDLSQPYTIPPDNPWVNAAWDGTPARAEIWAAGLRNPWRYSVDRATGDLWIGDVGDSQFEEINLAPAGLAGLNFGWPLLEGASCSSGEPCGQEDFTTPLYTYDHSGRCAVTGGYVYHGSQFPALTGVYFFGDYCSGELWATWREATGAWQTQLLLDSELQISSFGEDEAGELFVTDLSGGTISQLVAEASE